MKIKPAIVCSAVLTAASAFYAITHKNSSEARAQSTESTASPDSGSDAAEDALIAPFRINRETGEVLTAKGELIDDAELNSEEYRSQRILAIWAIENPSDYQQQVPALYPPKLDPNEPLLDITNPEAAAAYLQTKETPEQRESREWAALAITDPAAYAAELEKRKATDVSSPSAEAISQ